MNDDLIFAIFKELAVAEGKRKPDGTWAGTDTADVQRLLARAFGAVGRSASGGRGEDKNGA